MQTLAAMNPNKKNEIKLKEMRDKLNTAVRNKDFDIAVETCQEIIAFAAKAKEMNIIVPLYYKDMGEAYLKLLEYEKAHESFKTAHAGLTEYRKTQKLKFPEDWLAELTVIQRLIDKVERVHLKDKFF